MTAHRILVTGAAGCVGRALCRTLLARGTEVRAVVRSRASSDRLPTGVEIGWCGEMSPTTEWPSALFAEVDAVVHLAAKVHCRNPADVGEFMTMNAAATETFARAAAAQVRRFVYCSSAHAVGNFSEHPLDETSPCRPKTAYGASKLAAETIVRQVAHETGVEAVVVRPVPIYGPELPGSLMRVLQLLARGWPLPIGAIHNRRSLVYVENVADALVAAARHPAAPGETFFVSDGRDVSLCELAGLFAGASGRRARTIPIPPRGLRFLLRALGQGDAAERLLGSLVVDSGKLQRTLDWQPPYALPAALSDTAAWLQRAA